MFRIYVARKQLNATIFTCRSAPTFLLTLLLLQTLTTSVGWATRIARVPKSIKTVTTFNATSIFIIIIFITISISILVIIIIIIIIPVVMPAAILHPMRPSPLVWPELSTYTRFTGSYAPILKIEFELLPSLQSVRLLALHRLIGNKNLLWCHPAVLSMFTVIVCIHCIHSL